MDEFNSNEWQEKDEEVQESCVNEPEDSGKQTSTGNADTADSGAVVEEEKIAGISQKNWDIACLILGIVSVVFAWFGYGAIIGLIAGIIGVIMAKKCKDAGIENGKKTAGLILSIIGIIGGAIVFVSCVLCTGVVGCASCAAAISG